MDDLAAFLNARLDEDEARANAMRHFTVAEDEYYSCPATRDGEDETGDLPWGEDACWCGLAKRKARALREAEAKRAIIKCHPSEPMRHIDANRCPQCELTWPCLTVTSLAAVYSDHPDWRPEWKP